MRSGWLVEQLIRGRGAPNGTAELMIGEATAAFLAAGSEYVTLGLSPLSQHSAAALRDNPAWLRWILGWMRAHGRRFYNFAGLDAFKRKFRPTSWEPVYAICNRPSFSPAALYAIACAFTAGRPFRTVVHALAQAVAREVQWEPGLWRNSGICPAT
jgi:phosphatidylglycerol lysyltransferase